MNAHKNRPDPHHSTALSIKNTQLESTTPWQSQISEVLNKRKYNCRYLTPDSSKELQKSVGYFVDGTNVPYDIESRLFESFQEDDYDGALHLIALTDEKDDTIGIAFWREMPEKEMKEWINYGRLAEIARKFHSLGTDMEKGIRSLAGTAIKAGGEIIGFKNDKKKKVAPNRDESLHLARQESLRWLGQVDDISQSMNNLSLERQNRYVPLDYAQSWIKIELVAVRPTYYGKGIGSLLLACVMYQAWLHNDRRCVLHVAGGSSNVPAMRLYDRFGFVPAKGLFHKPDRDIYVLGNIELSLQSILWSETLKLK